jgi:hypothetical protein
MDKNAEAQKIIIQYSDGSSVELDKGIAVHFAPSEEDPDSSIITLKMVSLSGEEVQDFIIAMVALALRIENHRGEEK